VNVSVDSSSSDYAILRCNNLSASANGHPWRNAIHYIRIAGFADRHNPSRAHPNISFDYSPMIQDHCVGNNQIESACRGGHAAGLAHAVPQILAAAELRLFTRQCQVLLNRDQERRIRQPDSIAGGWSIEIGILAARDPQRHS
jgi:hypothetical protein